MRKIIYLCLSVLYGCASSTQTHLDTIQNDFANGNFESVIQNSDNSVEPDKQNNLELLINGTALFHENKFMNLYIFLKLKMYLYRQKRNYYSLYILYQ